MSIRTRIILLALVMLAPAAITSILGIFHVYAEEKRSFERGLGETSRALALVVDREIVSRDAILATLATSPALDRNNLETFQTQAGAVAASCGAVITLSDGSGRYLLSAPELPGVNGDLTGDLFPETLRNSNFSDGATISNLFVSPVDKSHAFAVRRPVVRNGQTRYFLTMLAPVRQLQSVMSEQQFPDGWTGAILDRAGVIVARNIDPEHRVGTRATPDVVERVLSGENQRIFKSVTRDGVPTIASLNRAPISGWSFIIGVPRGEAGRSATGAVILVVSVSAVLLGVAAVLAIRLGKTIERPVLRLAHAAQAMGRGEAVPAEATGLREMDMVSKALSRASEHIRDANAVMAERVAEAVAASERSQQALLQAQKLEALGRLTGGIAHDFNNLLQTLSTGIHLADETATDPDAKDALAACGRALGRAAKLTRQLMAFGRNQVSEARPVDLRTQILAMEDLFKSALRSNIVLRLDLSEELWPVYADPLQFEMAVLNLVFNARDAIKEKGQVTISAENRPVAANEIAGLSFGDYVRIQVRDTGDGMPPEVITKALEPFFTTKAVGKGSGLGLAQVYGFIQQAGGTVTLESQVKQGTVVTLYIPRSTQLPQGAERMTARPGNVGGPRATVLVVEDDVLVRDVVGPALTGYGFRVIMAGTADEALPLFEKHPEIDIVFSDIIMPGQLNGVELAKLIRGRNPEMPIVLATGYSEQGIDPAFGWKVISKPYDVAVLANVLREAVRKRAEVRLG